MSTKDSLTNEHLLKMFDNQFELVNYAIQLAERMIESGLDPLIMRYNYAKYNLATQILDRIRQGKDRYQDIETEEELISTLEVDLRAAQEINEENPE